MDPAVVQKLIIIWVAVGIGSIIAIPIVLKRNKLKESGMTEQHNSMRLLKRYDFYINNAITSKRFHNIVKSYIALSCLTTTQVKENSVRIFEKAIRSSAFIPLFLGIMTKEVTITLLGVLAAFVFYDTLVEKTIDKMYTKLIEDVSGFIQTLKLNYMEYNNVAKSVIEADRGDFLDTVVTDIFNIITALDSDSKLREFIVKSPLKILCELAEVCHITVEYGDSYDERGQSQFIKQLDVIEKEVFLEIRTIKEQQIKFKNLDKMALAGLIAMPLIDIYLLKQMPGTAVIIKGVFGMFTKVLIIIFTMVAYYVVAMFNRKTVVTQTDFSETVYQLSQDKRFKKHLENIKPKKYKDLIKVEHTLESSLSAHSIDTFYTAKALYAILGAVVGLILCVMFIFAARNYIYHHTGSLSITPILVEARIQEDIDKVDLEYMKMKEKPKDADLVEYVEAGVRGLNPWEVKTQVERLEKKSEIYDGIYFKWYYLLVIYGIGVIGWYLPNIKIKLRKFLVKFEADEDAAQLQTVMITLSGTGMSVYEVLYRLLDLSTIHQSCISYACQTYIKDPEMALKTLAYSSDVPEFKTMCKKLEKAIYSIPIGDAFRNIIVEKEQALSIKELYIRDMIRKKASVAQLIAMAPFACVLVLQTLGPLLILGFMQFSEMTTALTTI